MDNSFEITVILFPEVGETIPCHFCGSMSPIKYMANINGEEVCICKRCAYKKSNNKP